MNSTILRCLAHCEQRGMTTSVSALAHQTGESEADIATGLSELQASGLVESRNNAFYLTANEPKQAPEPEPEPVEAEVVVTEEATPEPVKITEYPRASLAEYVGALNHQNDVFEIRILRKSPYLARSYVGRRAIGYFNSIDALEEAIQPYMQDEQTAGIYITLHSPKAELFARSANRFKAAQQDEGTKDDEITHINVFPIDVDSPRSSGISATTDEILKSQAKATEILEWFAERGIEAMLAFSGNGWHVLIFLNETPATEDNTRLLKESGDRVGAHWDTDVTIYNLSRILKLYNTWVRKGDATEDRPHRISRIRIPDNPPRYDFADVVRVVNELPAPIPDNPPSQAHTKRTQRASVPHVGVSSSLGKRLPAIECKEDWATIASEAGAYANGTWKKRSDGWWVLRVHCPFCKRDNHGFISYADMSNKFGFRCHSNTCKSNGNPNHRSVYELAGYVRSERPQNSSLSRRIHNMVQRAEMEIGVELPQLSDWDVEEDEDGSVLYYLEGLPCRHHEKCTQSLFIRVSGLIINNPKYLCTTEMEKLNEPPF